MGLEEGRLVNLVGGDGEGNSYCESCCCAICLEEVSGFQQSHTSLACLAAMSFTITALFNVQWLSMSHHCPLCRFKMPTFF